MKNILFTIFACTNLLLVGCDQNNSDNDPNKQSTLIGLWSTQACVEGEIWAGEIVTRWGNTTVNFSPDGNLIPESMQLYEDSSCTNDIAELDINQSESTIIYADLGAEILQEGISGGRIIFRFTDDQYEIEGYYTIHNGELCFSHNIQISTYSFWSTESKSTSIDFENCLTKANAE